MRQTKHRNARILCIILGTYTTACTIASKCWRMQQVLIHPNFIRTIIFHNASVYTIWDIVIRVNAYYCLYCWVCVCCGGLIRYSWQWYCWTPFMSYSAKETITTIMIVEDLSGYGFSQWEATLQCNTASRCLSPYPGWSLGNSAFKWWWYKSLICYQRLKFNLNDCNQILKSIFTAVIH